MNQAKTIVITGASDGIGAAAARELRLRGHDVIIVGRSPDKTKAVAAEIGAASFVADFTRLDEVRGLAGTLNANYRRIDVLANNAGGVFGDPGKTVDGFERTFQINHLAPFLLTTLLIDNLVASQASVIQTASIAPRIAPKIDIDDLNRDRNFNPVSAYGAVKIENILFTSELHRRYHAAGLSTACFYPGNVSTNFGKQSTSRLMKFIATNPLARSLLLTTPKEGARQLVWLAEGKPGVDWTSGAYYRSGKPASPGSAQARDAGFARRLWDKSEQLLAASNLPPH